MGLATLLGSFLGLGRSAYAQGAYVDDALLYSRLGPNGTARTLGLAGANVALGADFSNLTSNPAGLGFYTKSEFTFTPGLGFGSADAAPVGNAASMGGGSQTQSANSFHVASAGIVFASRRPDGDNSSDWRGGSFALGFTRQADFNQSFRYQNNTNDDHSFFQYLREPGGYSDYTSEGYQRAVRAIKQQDTQGNYLNLDGLAYGNFLTDFVRVRRPGGSINDSLYRTSTPLRTGVIQQNEQVVTTGSLSQFDLGYGGNYRNKLYVGGGLGIVSLNRTRTSTFGEGSGGGEDFNYQDYVKTTGSGINARLGLIYRATDAVRFGASIQTPTYIRLTDSYSTTLTSQYAPANKSNVLTTAPGTFDYSIVTPFRASGGAVVLFKKYGFLSGDAEYVGYSQTRYNSNTSDVNSDLEAANQSIKKGYRNTVNLRVGAEGRIDIFRVRAGYARYGNPYASTSFDRAQNYFTGGVGLRSKSFFIDAAGVYLTSKELYSPYTLASAASPSISIDNKRLTVTVTGGLSF